MTDESLDEQLRDDPMAMCVMRYLVDHGRMSSVEEVTTGVRKTMRQLRLIDADYWDEYESTVAGLIVQGFVYLMPRTGVLVLTTKKGWLGATVGNAPAGRKPAPGTAKKPPSLPPTRRTASTRGDHRRAG